MRLLVYGEDTFRSRRKLAALRERFSATRDLSGINVSTLRASESTTDDAAEVIFASPFLSEKKLVILEGFLQENAEAQSKIGDALKRKPESTIVILFETSGAETLSKSPLFSDLIAEKFSEQFSILTASAAEKFVVEECSIAGAKIESKLARLLVSLVGHDSWQLHEESCKLSAYALASTKGLVTEDAIRSMVSAVPEEPIFAFLDACAGGKSAEAVRLLEQLLRSGVSELQIIAMLTKHYRSAVAASDLLGRGNSDTQLLAKSLGIQPFPASKAFVFARKRSKPSLQKEYNRLVTMERDFKSGGPKPRVSLSLFAATLEHS